MHPRDFHAECLECLTTSHNSGDCGICKGICLTIYSCRLGIVGEAIQNHKWPADWRQRLAIVEKSVWATPVAIEHNSPDSSEDEIRKKLTLKRYCLLVL